MAFSTALTAWTETPIQYEILTEHSFSDSSLAADERFLPGIFEQRCQNGIAGRNVRQIWPRR